MRRSWTFLTIGAAMSHNSECAYPGCGKRIDRRSTHCPRHIRYPECDWAEHENHALNPLGAAILAEVTREGLSLNGWCKSHGLKWATVHRIVHRADVPVRESTAEGL